MAHLPFNFLCVLVNLSLLVGLGLFQPNRKRKDCPTGWIAIDKPLQCVRLSSHRSNWTEARDHCLEKNGTLAVAHTSAVTGWIWDKFQLRLHEEAKTFWMGARRRDSGGNKKWIWLDDPDEISYSDWKDSDPPWGKPCGFLTRMEGWNRADCDSTKSFLCEMAAPGNGCPEEWFSISEISTCIREFRVLKSWYDARKCCQDLGGDLITIRNDLKKQHIHGYFDSRLWMWIGLNDRKNEGNFVWLDGVEFTYQNWRGNHPAVDTLRNCVAMDYDGFWMDISCSERHRFVCLKQSPHGPRTPVMHIYFHRPHNTFFQDEPAVVTCTSHGVINGEMYWHVVKGGSKIYLKYDTHHTTSDSTLDGEEVELTVSRINFSAPAMMNRSYISCYPYMVAPGSGGPCADPSDPYAYCTKSALVHVVDGPKGPPVLKWNVHEQPNILVDGKKLTATCQVYVGEEEGEVMWVLYSPSLRGPLALARNNKHIKSYEETTDNQSKKVVRSILEYDVWMSLSHLSIACFAYDAITYAHRLECRDEDRYCKKTPEFIVVKRDIPDPRWFTYPREGFFIGSLLLLLTLLTLYWPIKWFGQADIPPEPEGAGSLVSGPTRSSVGSAKSAALSIKSGSSFQGSGRYSFRKSLQE